MTANINLLKCRGKHYHSSWNLTGDPNLFVRFLLLLFHNFVPLYIFRKTPALHWVRINLKYRTSMFESWITLFVLNMEAEIRLPAPLPASPALARQKWQFASFFVLTVPPLWKPKKKVGRQSPFCSLYFSWVTLFEIKRCSEQSDASRRGRPHDEARQLCPRKSAVSKHKVYFQVPTDAIATLLLTCSAHSWLIHCNSTTVCGVDVEKRPAK